MRLTHIVVCHQRTVAGRPIGRGSDVTVCYIRFSRMNTNGLLEKRWDLNQERTVPEMPKKVLQSIEKEVMVIDIECSADVKKKRSIDEP